jgi:hypothetical protein
MVDPDVFREGLTVAKGVLLMATPPRALAAFFSLPP